MVRTAPILHCGREFDSWHGTSGQQRCQLDCIDPSPLSREEYFQVLHRAAVREAQELDSQELDSSLKKMGQNLEVIFGMFHGEMIDNFQNSGRRKPSYAPTFWKEKMKKYLQPVLHLILLQEPVWRLKRPQNPPNVFSATWESSKEIGASLYFRVRLK